MDGRAATAVRQRLESLAAAGVTVLPKPGPDPRAAAPRPPVSRREPPAATSVDEVPPPAAVLPADRTAAARALAVLRQEVADCTRCVELAGARTQTVFGAGSVAARLCFFGEAPRADEDASGEPFVGKAGQLLTKIIEACTLSRDDVYILNVLKCRPPGNRTPMPDEVEYCRGFFERQFAAIDPEFICCLGTTAAQALLRTAEPIGRLRGRWFTHGRARVLCTYHPSYLLRNPAAKKDVWADMRMLMQEMGLGG